MTDVSPQKGGIELVVYQIGELKNSVTALVSKMDDFQAKIDKRVTDLERWKIEIEADAKTKTMIFGRWDLSTILLAVLSAVIGGVAEYLARGGLK